MNGKAVYFADKRRWEMVGTEPRTPSAAKRCVTCTGVFHETMLILWGAHQDGDYVCVGWECLPCAEEDKAKANYRAMLTALEEMP